MSAEMKLCRICLSREGRLYSMSECGLKSAFQLLTGMPVDVNKRLPPWVCAECGIRLMSYDKLRQKSHRSHEFLTALLTSNIVNIENIIWSKVARETRLNVSETVLTQYEPSTQDSEPLPLDVPLHIQLDVKTEDKNIYSEEKHNINIHTDKNDTEYPITAFENEDDSSVAPEELIPKPTPLLRERQGYIFYRNQKTIDLEPNEKWKGIIKREPIVNLVRLQLESNEKILKKNEIKPEPKDGSEHSYFEACNDDEAQCHDMGAFNPKPKITDKKNITQQGSTFNLPKNHKSKVRKPKAKAKKKQNEKERLNNMFTRRTLSHEESKAAMLKRKMSSNYFNAKFKCTECFRGFVGEAAFERHKFVHSETSGPLTCDICKMRFSSRVCLVKHLSVMHTIYTCKKCGFVANNQSFAVNHKNEHLKLKFQCKQCKLEFPKSSLCNNHVRTFHASEFVCELCGLTFISKIGVRRHKNLIHHRSDTANTAIEGPHCTTCDIQFATEEAYDKHLLSSSKHVTVKLRGNSECTDRRSYTKKPMVCQLCNLTLGCLKDYLEHFRTVHRGLKLIKPNNFVCDVCGQGFMYRCLYNYHYRSHNPDPEIKCTICERVFSSKYALQRHVVVHDKNGIRYPCKICGKSFTALKSLREHLATAHSTDMPYECAVCARRFKIKSHLKTHLKTHDENRTRFSCKLCDDDFASVKTLKMHVKVHTKQFKYTCEFCAKQFVDKTAFRAHVDYVHHNKPQ